MRCLHVLLSFMVVVCAGAVQADEATPSAFDKPRTVTRVPLPPNPMYTHSEPAVTCWYYDNFMVKQVDLGDQGAAELAVLPGEAPVCQRKVLESGEIAIPPKNWAGYFKGVVGKYVFLDGSSDFGGGRAFAIFTPNAKRIFDDVAHGFSSTTTTADGVSFRYARIYASHCSLAGKNAGECWKMIAKETGLKTPPDCKTAYVDPDSKSVFGVEDPSLIEYDAEATVTDSGSKIVPLQPDRAAICRMT